MKFPCPYKAILFDFDGVIAESTDIKTQAFHELFKHHPRVKEIVRYHESHAGVSRFIKFRHIYKHYIHKSLSQRQNERLSRQFSSLVFKKVISCPLVPGVLPFLQKAQHRLKLFVISATPQGELRKIIKGRKLESYFLGVYGAPSAKPDLIRRILCRSNFNPSDVLYIGDARADWEAARAERVHFLGRIHGSSNPFPESVSKIANLNELPFFLMRSNPSARLKRP